MNLLANVSTDSYLKLKVFVECSQDIHSHYDLNRDRELCYHKTVSEVAFTITTPDWPFNLHLALPCSFTAGLGAV